MFRRMHFGEDREEIAVERGGIRHTGVAEEQGKNGCHGDPENHPGDKMRCAGAIETVDKEVGDERSVLGFTPGDAGEQAGLHGEIKDRDAENRKKNAARNIFFGIADFAAEVADVVVAPVAVNGVDHGGTEAGEPEGRKMKRAGRKIKGQFGIEVANAAPDEPEHGADDTDPEEHGDFSDGGNFPVKKDHKKNYQAAGDGFGLPECKRMEISGIARETDGSGSDGERGLDKGLPDEEEGHQTSPAARAVGFAKEDIGAAGLGHGGAEFGPDEAIERGEKRASEPRDEGLRAAHSPDHEGNDDQRDQSEDLDHGKRYGIRHAEAALEGGLRLGERGGWRGKGHEQRE